MGDSSSSDELKDIEKKLSVNFPGQVYDFYQHVNGLSVSMPMLKIYCLSELNIENDKITFALLDNKHKLAFAVNQPNFKLEVQHLLIDFIKSLRCNIAVSFSRPCV